jgi:uncharacterized protein YjbI with pentapeptide repeats
MGLIVGYMVLITLSLMGHSGHFGVFSAKGSELVIVPRWLPRPLNIVRADLKGKWLAEVNLRFADARFANLEGTDLRFAKLQGADLQGANLQRANLWAVELQGADLQSTDLRGVIGLTPAELQEAQTDAHTQLPDALQRLIP